jgi:hypothetical protein
MDQLDDLLLEYIHKKSIITHEMEERFRTKVQESHLKSLPDNKSLIITDTHELRIDPDNTINSEKKLIYGKTINLKTKADWIWKFDNSRMYRCEANTWFKVVVFEKLLNDCIGVC